uniref:Solute carrier family 66 member 3 n=1 Tax=Suricata suricatta TaxID=37032 RepID=A0A673UPF0_SURSU
MWLPVYHLLSTEGPAWCATGQPGGRSPVSPHPAPQLGVHETPLCHHLPGPGRDRVPCVQHPASPRCSKSYGQYSVAIPGFVFEICPPPPPRRLQVPTTRAGGSAKEPGRPGAGRAPPAPCQLRCSFSLPSFLVFLRYQCYYEYPLLTFLEYPILIAQDALLLLCVFHFNGNVKGAAPYMALFVVSWFVLPLQKWIMDLAMNLSTFISAASKFAQLQYLWRSRDSGAVSALTWSLAAYTCATRIITTLMTTSDLTILMRFLIMLALNVWVTATVLRYRKTAVKAE